MRNFLNVRQWHIWIACFAILVNALAPSVSHALTMMDAKSGSASALGFAEICSTQAASPVSGQVTSLSKQQDQSVQDPLQSALHHLKHCQCCVNQAGNPVLPVPDTEPLIVLSGHDAYPSLFYHSPSPLFSWASSHARAPPASA
ncbi:DUF2946 domain-containing protein [Undibacterium sp. RuRC25W]|uniref:DUF2946 domain-containing protein n=1 Tax=Undibacterium sp. RuRC25W TaxID=3413047 RepID=UPI003BF1799C